MIKLESRVNGVKARVSLKNPLSISVDIFFLSSTDMQVQAFGWTAIYAKDEQDKAKMNIENADEFIKNIKEMILVSEYMKRDEVQKIFKAQGDRVKIKFKEVEEGLEKNWAKEPRKYIKQGLDMMWAKWLKEHVPKASKKLADEIAVHAGILETFIEQRELFEDIQKKKPEKDRVKITPEEQKLLDGMKASVKKAKAVLVSDQTKPLIPNPWA